MKKLLFALIVLTSTSILEAKVIKLSYENRIDTYCIHSYIFVRYNGSDSNVVQVMMWDNKRGVSRPMKCSDY